MYSNVQCSSTACAACLERVLARVQSCARSLTAALTLVTVASQYKGEHGRKPATSLLSLSFLTLAITLTHVSSLVGLTNARG